MTLETYILRDATCDAFEAAKDGKLVTWYVQTSSDLSFDIEELIITRAGGFWLLEITRPLWILHAHARRGLCDFRDNQSWY